tara:strand:+ start:11689 stop:13194 length:1506 start_codon:yes stop_codon:yes gene_type:complete
VLLAALTLLAVGGCRSSSRYAPSGNPLLDVRNPELLARDRVRAAEEAWAEVEAGVRARERTREAFKSLAWSNGTEEPVRLTLVRLLMSDTTQEGAADSLSMARLMLPTERSPVMTRLLAETAAARGWEQTLPALVRSYARSSTVVRDADRPERKAIAALRPDQTVEETIYSVFLRPLAASGAREGAVLRSEDRTRDDAWTLLSRLDQDGRARARLIGEPVPSDADAGSAADVETLRAGLRDLRVLPRTGEELAWLRRLHRHPEPELRDRNSGWWSRAASAIGGLNPEQRRGLELRHAEAIRWTAANRPGWIAMSRAQLLDELAGRLNGRTTVRRDAERGKRPRLEKLSDWADQMSWGDVVVLLVVDEAVASESARRDLWSQIELDRKDTATEYGGVLEFAETGEPRMVLFRPRARDRLSDDMFVASGDMIRFSDLGLAHYHMQVQKARMGRQAGPSDGDMLYAAASGRTCLVFTSVASDGVNADLYTPSGAVIDLGIVNRP